jgi:hypothetical protein
LETSCPWITPARKASRSDAGGSSFTLHPSSFILLELMPLRLNMGKKDTMGQRQLDLLRRFRQAGLF